VKRLGIVGGLGPESTVDYYRSIIEVYRERNPDGSYPTILINSIDLTRMIAFVEAREWTRLAIRLAEEVRRLARAGADIALISANTPHIVFDEVRRKSHLPLISIVEVTAVAAKERGLARLGLFGTRFTVEAGFYQSVFAAAGMAVVAPEADEVEEIHEKYMGELVKGVFLPETRERLLAIARRMKQREKIDGLILGGTELPLILKDPEIDGIPVLDTTRIHVEAAVSAILA